jgi:hypothetical protein
MAKAVLILANDSIRERAIGWIKSAEEYSRVTFQGPVRTLPQNAKLHAMLTDIAKQRPTLGGTRMNVERWKRVFMNHLGSAMEYLPTLDGDGFFPAGYRTSELSVPECCDLIESIYAWGASNEIVWSPYSLKETPND